MADEPDQAAASPKDGRAGGTVVRDQPPRRVIAGVARDLAGRLGVDPVWLRLAFVGLALFGGLGVIVYGALWLMLVAERRPGWSLLRYVGALALAVGTGVMLSGERSDLIEGSWALAALLTGGALALWQPRHVPGGDDQTASTEHLGEPHVHAAPSSPSRRWSAGWGRRRPRSVLGRATLSVALVVVAALAVVDEANGGRLHPEQWLGTGAAICAAGAFVGAWRQRALWLVLPGLLFAA